MSDLHSLDYHALWFTDEPAQYSDCAGLTYCWCWSVVLEAAIQTSQFPKGLARLILPSPEEWSSINDWSEKLHIALAGA